MKTGMLPFFAAILIQVGCARPEDDRTPQQNRPETDIHISPDGVP